MQYSREYRDSVRLLRMSLFRRFWQNPDSGDPAWYVGPYFIMCCVMVTAVLLYPLVHTLAGIVLLQIVYTAILLSALYTVMRSPTLFRAGLVLLIPALFANWVLDPIGQPVLSIVASSAILAIMLAAIGSMLRHIITAKRISQDIIFGSVAVYLLAGVTWAFCYEFLNDITPGQVIESVGNVLTMDNRAAMFPEFTYFSFITLTSVGYGDLTPIGPPARALAIVEGIFGQLYTAILIGKLVGMQVAQDG